MLKYSLTGLFILALFGLLQHPVPILEGVEVYAEKSPIIPDKPGIPLPEKPLSNPFANRTISNTSSLVKESLKIQNGDIQCSQKDIFNILTTLTHRYTLSQRCEF